MPEEEADEANEDRNRAGKLAKEAGTEAENSSKRDGGGRRPRLTAELEQLDGRSWKAKIREWEKHSGRPGCGG